MFDYVRIKSIHQINATPRSQKEAGTENRYFHVMKDQAEFEYECNMWRLFSGHIPKK